MKPVKRMIQDIEREVGFTAGMIGRQELDPRVMEAVKKVPREEFVPVESRGYAYENGPLPIGHGQTISQPYIVALMTDLLEPEPDHVVLEVGTGSGYQAAILSLLVERVYSIEIVEPLARAARARLRRLGYGNIEIRVADGYHGWAEHAPFDGIVVTAAAPVIPEPLVEQLKPGGRLVIPVGQPYSYQELMLVEKSEDSQVKTKDVLGVAFVPLTGKHHD
ncbi:MAG: protein-L-isoaspartate(D-aspartate) O-methyltransferase [Thiohalobacterales bacterium]|nr:protein-L-isoaspartate(D-aspartate) O-methyltransferase [Thiohalobacterales bacterium]